MSTRKRILLLTLVLMAAPGALAADDMLSADPELRPAYCAGYFEGEEQTIGDTCHIAEAGWENGCSEVARRKNRSLEQWSAGNPRNAIATQAGYADYRQCITEVSSDAGVTQTLECEKHFTGRQLSICISSGPATPACKRLLPCAE